MYKESENKSVTPDITKNKNLKQSNIKDVDKMTIKQIVTNFITSLFILCLIPVVILLNNMCENGGKIRILTLNSIKLEYFNNYKFIGIIVLWLIHLVILAFVPIGKVFNSRTKEGVEIKYRCNG